MFLSSFFFCFIDLPFSFCCSVNAGRQFFMLPPLFLLSWHSCLISFCFSSPCPVFISSHPQALLTKLHTKPGSVSHLLRESALLTVICISICIFTFWWSYCDSSLLPVAWITVFDLLTLPIKKTVGGLKLLYTNSVVIYWSHWSTISML